MQNKFNIGDKVLVGDYPMQREGVIVANGPFKSNEQHYFVKTNLGEDCYRETDLNKLNN